MIAGRRLERYHDRALADQGLIGAMAFLSNLVIVENCVTKLARPPGLPGPFRAKAEAARQKIRTVVDREVRNTGEHIDDRVVARADQGLVSTSIFEPDLLCSTRDDGSVGAVAVNHETFLVVAEALNSLLPGAPGDGVAKA